MKKLELEEHDRQRRRSKTFSEMMEERGNRGRKLSISLAMYHEEDANDLSDLGIGTSSGKSSVSGDTHDDTHSVLVIITLLIFYHDTLFNFYNWPVTKPLTSSKYIYIYIRVSFFHKIRKSDRVAHFTRLNYRCTCISSANYRYNCNGIKTR